MMQYRFKELRRMGNWVCLLALLAGLVTLVDFCDHVYLNVLLDGIVRHDMSSVAQLRAHSRTIVVLQQWSNLGHIALYFCNDLLFCFWLYRAACNVRALGATGLEYSPGWTVGWLFVPFANLVMGYRVTREVWLSSHHPHDWTPRGPSRAVLAWWLFSVTAGAANILSMLMFRRHQHNLDNMLQASMLETTGLGLLVIATGIFIHVVWRISAVQMQHRLEQPDAADARLPDAPQPA